jgi:hypothetical protein
MAARSRGIVRGLSGSRCTRWAKVPTVARIPVSRFVTWECLSCRADGEYDDGWRSPPDRHPERGRADQVVLIVIEGKPGLAA